MDKHEQEIVTGLIVSLIAIMEETTDSSTKDRIDEQINQLMTDLNLTWDHI